ncbi:tetratricopeptide repeat protein, partial [Pseudodesulfovibrio sp.]|nr:tetratricopeptide repeat protein [Pseudodesulfovibrio sp.]
EQLGNGKFSVCPINSQNVPSGEERTITLKQLMEKYVPEVEFFEEKTVPAMELLEEHMDDGDMHRAEGKHYSAEGDFKKALTMDAANVRALFSLGLVYLEVKDMEKAKEMMGTILDIKTAFTGKNQHLFNEFGISLRKQGLHDEAVEYYSQAIRYVKNDENLYYNLARANFERSNWTECVEALGLCYAINKEMKEANDLFSIILRMSTKPELAEKAGKQPVQKSAVDRIRDIYRGDGPQLPVEKPLEVAPIAVEQNAPEIGRARAGGPIDVDGAAGEPINVDDAAGNGDDYAPKKKKKKPSGKPITFDME